MRAIGSLLVSSLSLALSVVACSPTSVGELARPTPASAANAMGMPALRCAPGSAAEPLIVDLPSMERADLEEAMKRGTVLVSYDCERLDVLPACRAPGEYRYAGVSRKEDVIHLDDQLEVRASLPLSGAKLGGELAQGTSLVLALVQVGKRSNIFDELGRPEVSGGCEAATHFVRAANVGAFSLDTGASGRAAVVADMFGAEGGVSAASSKSTARRDGSLDACRTAKPDAAAPPDECQTPLRLELVPLAAAVPIRMTSSQGGEPKGSPLAVTCPGDLVFVGGKCTAKANAPHLCDPADEADCTAQCDAGHAGSCYNLGLIWQAHDNDPKNRNAAPDRTWEQIVEDTRKAAERLRVPFEKACDGGEARSCDRLAYLYMQLKLGPEKSQEKWQQACDLGMAEACMVLAGSASRSAAPADVERARSLYGRACRLGSWRACMSEVDTFLRPAGNLPPNAMDVQTGVTMLEGLCRNHVASACHELAGLRREGKLVARDEAMATSLLADSCTLGWSEACLDAGTRYFTGDGAPKLPSRAEALFEKACPEDLPEGKLDACVPTAQAFRTGAKGLPKDLGRAQEYLTRSCRRGWTSACVALADMAAKGQPGPANPRRAAELYAGACAKEAVGACMSWAKLVEDSDKTGAKAMYERYCRGSLVEACDGYQRLGGDPEIIRGKEE